MIFSKLSFIIFIIFFLTLSIILPNSLSVFKNFIPVFLGFVMFCMGMTLNFSKVKKVLSKPYVIVTAVCLQFSAMPLAAYILIKIFSLPPEYALGIIILGSCPGGTASNLIAYLCKADVALSILCTFISTLFSVILTPFLIFFLTNENINIEVKSLIKSSFFIVFFPVLFGLLLNPFLKNVKIINIFLPKISEFFIALIIGVIFSLNIENIQNVSYLLLLSIVIHNLFGLTVGYFVASILRLSNKEKKTFAIEVGMQNSGFGMTLSLIHFGKMVALPSAIFSLWHNISSVVLVYLWKKK